jgi:hypothetical protein
MREVQCTVQLASRCGSPPSAEANVSPQPLQHDSFIPARPAAIIPTSRQAPRRSKRPFLYDLRIVICLASRAPECQGNHFLHAPVSAMLEAGVWPCFPGRYNQLCCFVFVSCVFCRWKSCAGRGYWGRMQDAVRVLRPGRAMHREVCRCAEADMHAYGGFLRLRV